MGKFRPLYDSLLNGLILRNIWPPKICGRDSIICTDSQKLNLQRKELAESGSVYTRLIKVRLGLRRLFRHSCKWTHISPLPPHPHLNSGCTHLAAPSLAPGTPAQVQQQWWLPSALIRLGLCQGTLTPASLTKGQETPAMLLRREGLLTGVGSSRYRWSAGKHRHLGDFYSIKLTSWIVIKYSVPWTLPDTWQILNRWLLDEHISCQGVAVGGHNLYPVGLGVQCGQVGRFVLLWYLIQGSPWEELDYNLLICCQSIKMLETVIASY